MQAIQTIIQMIAGEGDEIILPTPAWPNYAGPLRLQGSRPREVPMDFANGKWRLDLDRLFGAITPSTKAIVINSPSNPVGWTASLDELIAVRDECRKRGLWIVGDEVYARFYYGRRRRGAGAVLPRHLRYRGAIAARQYILQELGDDRLAGGLAAGAQGAGFAHRAHHPVQYQRHGGLPAGRLCGGTR